MEQESGMHTCTVGPMSECVARTIHFGVTVAGVAFKKNAVSFLSEASGGPSLVPTFLLPLDVAFFLICVAPGLAPLQPFLPTMLTVARDEGIRRFRGGAGQLHRTSSKV